MKGLKLLAALGAASLGLSGGFAGALEAKAARDGKRVFGDANIRRAIQHARKRYRGHGAPTPPRKRSNRLHVSKRVRRAHRRAA